MISAHCKFRLLPSTPCACQRLRQRSCGLQEPTTKARRSCLPALHAKQTQFHGALDQDARDTSGKYLECHLKTAWPPKDAWDDTREPPYQTNKLVKKLAASVRNRQCVLILLFVAPNIRHRPQSRQQRTGADQHNPFVETLLEQSRVMLQRQQVEQVRQG